MVLSLCSITLCSLLCKFWVSMKASIVVSMLCVCCLRLCHCYDILVPVCQYSNYKTKMLIRLVRNFFNTTVGIGSAIASNITVTV